MHKNSVALLLALVTVVVYFALYSGASLELTCGFALLACPFYILFRFGTKFVIRNRVTTLLSFTIPIIICLMVVGAAFLLFTSDFTSSEVEYLNYSWLVTCYLLGCLYFFVLGTMNNQTPEEKKRLEMIKERHRQDLAYLESDEYKSHLKAEVDAIAEKLLMRQNLL